MNINTLGKITSKKKKRVGQGHGSGRGKTAGRGQKGQKARNSIPLSFEGGALPLIKRMPYLRGKGRNASLKQDPIILTVGTLSKLPAKTIVDLETLIKYGLIKHSSARQAGVKILGEGELTIPLTVRVPVSQSAAEKIRQAGGNVGD